MHKNDPVINYYSSYRFRFRLDSRIKFGLPTLYTVLYTAQMGGMILSLANTPLLALDLGLDSRWGDVYTVQMGGMILSLANTPLLASVLGLDSCWGDVYTVQMGGMIMSLA